MSFTHPATTLALMLVSGKEEQAERSFEFAVQDVIAAVLSNWPDEAKADLYAQIVDSGVGAFSLFKTIQMVVGRAMTRTQERFPGLYE